MRNIYKALLPMILAIGIVGGIFIGKYVAFSGSSGSNMSTR